RAADGIRDLHGTGVQTCALPICSGSASERPKPVVSATRVLSKYRVGTSTTDLEGMSKTSEPGTFDGSGEVSRKPPPRTRKTRPQIGRASCRERRETGGAAGEREA